MKTGRFLSLLIATLLCLSSFAVFAEETVEVEIALDEIYEDDPTEEIEVESDDVDDGSIDYSDMSNWAYWNEGAGKPADLFFVCPTVDMGKDGNFNSDIKNPPLHKIETHPMKVKENFIYESNRNSPPY